MTNMTYTNKKDVRKIKSNSLWYHIGPVYGNYTEILNKPLKK